MPPCYAIFAVSILFLDRSVLAYLRLSSAYCNGSAGEEGGVLSAGKMELLGPLPTVDRLRSLLADHGCIHCMGIKDAIYAANDIGCGDIRMHPNLNLRPPRGASY